MENRTFEPRKFTMLHCPFSRTYTAVYVEGHKHKYKLDIQTLVTQAQTSSSKQISLLSNLFNT